MGTMRSIKRKEGGRVKCICTIIPLPRSSIYIMHLHLHLHLHSRPVTARTTACTEIVLQLKVSPISPQMITAIWPSQEIPDSTGYTVRLHNRV